MGGFNVKRRLPHVPHLNYGVEAGGAVAIKAAACCLTPSAIASMTRSGSSTAIALSPARQARLLIQPNFSCDPKNPVILLAELVHTSAEDESPAARSAGFCRTSP